MNLSDTSTLLDNVTKHEDQTGKYELVSDYIEEVREEGTAKSDYVRKDIRNKLGEKRTIFVLRSSEDLKS